jgi:DNA-binding response OmpR family regulator/PAS domain-containing protein
VSDAPVPSELRLLDALNEAACELAPDGRVVAATSALTTWTGIAFGSVETYRLRDALSSADSDRFEHTFKRVASAKTHDATLNVQWPLPDGGEQVPVEIKFAAITEGATKKDKNVRVIVWLRDTTAETAAEANANLQGTHLIDLVENITDACVVENAEGMIEMVNGAFCELFQIQAAPQSLVGTPCEDLFTAAGRVVTRRSGPLYVAFYRPDDDKETKQSKRNNKKSADSGTGSEAFQFGTASHEITQKSLAVMDEDAIAGRLHIFRTHPSDDAKKTNTAQSANTGLAAAPHDALDHAVIEQVANNLSHAIESVKRTLTHANQYDWPEPTLAELQRAADFADAAFTGVAGLVDQTRFQSAVTANSAPFELRETLATQAATLSSLFEANKISYRLRVEQDVPNTLIGDPLLLIRVLRQLAECALSDVAVRSGSDGEADATLALLITPEYATDNLIHLSFNLQRHDAPGTSAFAHPSSAHASGATHLSLARQGAQALARAGGENNGGAVGVRKTKDGELFHFTAPFAFTKSTSHRSRPRFGTLSGAAVLIVSAHADERQHLSELVRSWRMHPREADNADMALYLLNRMAAEETPIPLVITSNELPLQDGFLLAFRIKHDARLRDAIVMMVARNGKPGDAIHCRESGISAYLRHPMRPDQLQDAISAVMGAQDDAEATQTLITRHSLREAKAGTILIVDADHDQAQQATTMLKKHDYRVVVATLAEEALAALLQDVFDVIILDVATPGFDSIASGPALLRAQLTGSRNVAIIAALNNFERVSGADYQGVITKPYEKDALLEKITSIIGARSGNETTA